MFMFICCCSVTPVGYMHTYVTAPYQISGASGRCYRVCICRPASRGGGTSRVLRWAARTPPSAAQLQENTFQDPDQPQEED